MSTKNDDKETKIAPYPGLMDPKIDYAFKQTFGNLKHASILISFLNGVLGYSNKDDNGERITKVTIENPQIDKTMLEDKYCVLDVRATLNTKEVINIEIQIKNPGNMVNRLLYYLSKMLGNQLCKKESYNKLKRCVSIAVLNFNLVKNEKLHNVFHFRNRDDNEFLSDLLELHTIELPKLARQKNLDLNDLVVVWALFLSNPESEKVKKLQERVPEVKEAREVLEMLSHNKEARAIYEKRQQALRDKLSALDHEREEGLKEGLQKGEHNAQQKFATKLLLRGNSHADVAEYTELSLEEVKKLQKKLSH